EQPAPAQPSPPLSNALAGRLPSAMPRSLSGRGQQRSAIVRIAPDSTVETLWSSTEENAFDLSLAGNQMLFTTDEKGRVYQLRNGRELSLLAQTDQEQTTRVIPMGDFLLLTTANLGKVYRMDQQPANRGSFESEVRDAGNIAAWGQIRWSAEVPEGTSLRLFTRTGNSSRPDATWSEWSPAYTRSEGEPMRSPAARYAQWKAEFQSAGGRSPVLHEVTLAYLPRNRAPELTELRTTQRGLERPSSGSGASSGGPAAQARVGSTVRAFSGIGSAARQTQQPGVDISWLASDPDQDELTYTLYFRGEGEKEWKLLQENLSQNYFQLNPDALPDGTYRVKVVASDASQNPEPAARRAERISSPFLVDFTSPGVVAQSIQRSGAATGAGPGAEAQVTIVFRATDAASSLVRAEYAMDAEPLRPVLADDGIVDSPEETFSIRVALPDSLEHLITLRVYDAAGNVGVGKVVLPGQGTVAGP
ncbi:MAG TPA: fibronectin type III domain-containing protein, partial [Terriglobia bacterium]|nr:fibronectin type III domain-containing protein [Terriglobia bacterium]